MAVNKVRKCSNKKLTRKEFRKQMRNEKKLKKQAYFSKKPLTKNEDKINSPLKADSKHIKIQNSKVNATLTNKVSSVFEILIVT